MHQQSGGGLITRRLRIAATMGVGLMSLLGCTGKLGGGSGSGSSSETGGFNDPNHPNDPAVVLAREHMGTDQGCPETVPTAGTRLVRLTHLQYNNAVHELLALDPSNDPTASFQTDATAAGFNNNQDKLQVTGRLGRDYRRAAETLAQTATQSAQSYSLLVPCMPSGDGSACAQQFITAFLRKAYRRPPTDAEVKSYQQIFSNASMLSPSGGDPFKQGVQLVLEAALQSPNFLYRVELSKSEGLPGLIALGPYEVAVRLSFMLWDSLPDATLASAADAGQLSTAEQIAAQAKRMLVDPKAHGMVRDFHSQWLDVGHYSDLQRDPQVFPLFRQNFDVAMREETLRFADDVIFNTKGSLTALYTAPYTFVNADLAKLYGLSGNFSTDFQRVDLPPAQMRGGLFTQLGFLASHSYTTTSDPIHRGVFLHRQVLCTTIGSPPPGASMTPLPPASSALHTMRQRVAAQTSPSQCKACHGFINPVGFAFENFNAIGQFQTMDNSTPVDTSGSVQLDGKMVPFNSASEMMHAIAASDTARQCYVTQWFRFAYQREETDADRCSIQALTARMRGDAYSVMDLLTDLTQTRAFMYRPMEMQ